MKHVILFTSLCVITTSTAAPNTKYNFNTEIWHRGEHVPVKARSLDQGILSTLFPRSPTDPARPGQSRSGRGDSRSQNQGRTQSAGSSRQTTEQSRSTKRERSRSPVRTSSSNQPNRPAGSNTPSRHSSPARSVSSNQNGSPVRSISSGGVYHTPRSRSRASTSSPPASPRSSSSGTTSAATDSSGSADFPLGPHGEIPFPHDVIPPTIAAANIRGPAHFIKKSPHLDSDAGGIPRGYNGLVNVMNPFKSKVVGVTYGTGLSRARAEGDYVRGSIRTGPNSYGRLRTTTPQGDSTVYVPPNSSKRLTAETSEPALIPASVTAHLHGQGVFVAKGRNFR